MLSPAKTKLLERMLRGRPSEEVAPAPRGEPLPASAAQQLFWAIYTLAPESNEYVLPMEYRLSGSIDRDALVRAIGELFARHQALRMVFAPGEGELGVRVLSPDALEVGFFDRPPSAEELQRLSEPFDLARGPLFRASVFREGAEQWLLRLSTHHAVCDGVSLGILVHELSALYQAFAAGQPSPLSTPPLQFGDYAVWERDRLMPAAIAPHLDYWRKQLAGAPAATELPTDYPWPPTRGLHPAGLETFLWDQVSADVTRLAQEEGASPAVVLLAAWAVVLYRYTREEDLLISAMVAGRERPELERVVGPFMKALPLRLDVSGRPSSRELVRRVAKVLFGAYAHQRVSFDWLSRELGGATSRSKASLLQIAFVMNQDFVPLELGGPKVGFTHRVEHLASALELHVMFGRGLAGGVAYRADLFDPRTVTRLAESVRRALAGMLLEPDRAITELPIGDAPQAGSAADSLRADRTAAAPCCIHELLEAQAARTPGAWAVEHEHRRLTYAELHARADAVAARLSDLGIGPEQRVGVAFERSLEQLISLLAVLKAGGAYVPIDPAYPTERIEAMLEDGGLSVLLTSAQLEARFSRPGLRTAVVDLSSPPTVPQVSPPRHASADHLAYALFTSGSTGRPKAVAVTHRSLVSFTRAAIAEYGMTAEDRVLQFASISWDTSVEEIFPTLASGGTLVLAPPQLLEARALQEECRRARLTVLNLPTAFWHEVAGELTTAQEKLAPSVRLLIIGGEPATRWRAPLEPWVRLVNTYGTTEATAVSAVFDAVRPGAPWEQADRLPIGRPLGGTRLYVLDPELHPVPPGAMGELFVGGEGVARGYLNRPELTAERFVPDPFSTEPDARMYRTGDLVRVRGDGALQHLGRADRLVKLRGFRIEPAEIEAKLASHPAVAEAVVEPQSSPGGELLLAGFATLRPGQSADAAGLRAYLTRLLPPFMVPSSLQVLDALPKTPNGKLDRRALPQAVPAIEPTAPRNPTEEELAKVFAEVLGVERVGVHDDFFALGGHSLMLGRLLSAIASRFEGARLRVRHLFENPTVAQLAVFLTSGPASDDPANEVPPVTPTSPREREKLSLNDERFWVWHEEEDEDTAALIFHLAFELRGPVDLDRLKATLLDILRRNEVLRSNFARQPDGVRRVLRPVQTMPVEVHDVQGAPAPDAAAQALFGRLRRGRLDVSTDPLFQVHLVRLGPERVAVLWIAAHMVVDARSLLLLGEQLLQRYRRESPPAIEPLLQYGDFAAWERQWTNPQVLSSADQFWRRHLAGARPLNRALRTDYPWDEVDELRRGKCFGAVPLGQVTHTLKGADTAAIERSTQRFGVRASVLGYLGYATLLHQASGQVDLTIGNMTDLRFKHPELASLVGNLTYPSFLRLDMSGDPTMEELARRANDEIRAVAAVPDFPALHFHYGPLHDLVRVMYNFERVEALLPAPGLEIRDFEPGVPLSRPPRTHLDLTLMVTARPNEWRLDLFYNAGLWDEVTMTTMIHRYAELLRRMAYDPSARLSSLGP